MALVSHSQSRFCSSPYETLPNIHQSYDLFLHNCNNFTNDFSTFLVGQGIPSHITSLPQTVLDTPFGQMLKPQLDRSLRGITQATGSSAQLPARREAPNNRLTNTRSGSESQRPNERVQGIVYKPTTIAQLDKLLAQARDKCAVIFFTSATCPPCKLVYPAYDELAESAGNKAILIKVDLSESYEIGSRYQIRVTPTFWTFLKGEKESEWTGANESQLRGNVNLLIQMANPAHQHTTLDVPALAKPYTKPVIYTKIPPLEKLKAKLEPANTSIDALFDFVIRRQKNIAANASLPDLPSISLSILDTANKLPAGDLFPYVDLLRIALVDPRVSGYFTQDPNETLRAIIKKVIQLDNACPYQLRIVTIHLACNAFSTPLLRSKLRADQKFSTAVLHLITTSLLDSLHQPIRIAAASLAFNLVSANHLKRLEDEDELIAESDQVELMASLLETMNKGEDSKESLKGVLLASGLLKYRAPREGELDQLCQAVGAKDILQEVRNNHLEWKELATEVQKVMS